VDGEERAKEERRPTRRDEAEDSRRTHGADKAKKTLRKRRRKSQEATPLALTR